MNIADENLRQRNFAIVLTILLIAVSAFTIAVFKEDYQHKVAPSDCSEPYDYPMCAKSYDAQPYTNNNPTHSYLGILAVVVLGIISVAASWRASVTAQANIVSTFGKAPVQQQTQQPVQQPSVGDAWGHTIPPAIPDNDMPADAIVQPSPVPPPQGQPQQGVNPNELGGSK